MSVRQLPNGRYVIDYYENRGRGKRIRKILPPGIRDRATAESIERDCLKADRGETSADAHLSPSVTVRELFPLYLEWYKQYRSPTTYRDLNLVWEAHFLPILGKDPILSLNAGRLGYYKRLRAGEYIVRGFKKKGVRKAVTKKTVSNRTINKELAYFSGFLKWCRREKDMPLPPIHSEKLPHARPKPMVLSPEEIRRILDAAGPFHRAFILCLYSLGLRLSEVRFMRWENVDFSNEVVKVVQKGGEEKILPMNKWVKTALEGLERFGPYVFMARVRKGDAGEGRKPVGDIRQALKRICAKAGIEKKATHHLFRHTLATHLMGAGVNLRTIQGYLGHKQLTTTEFYTHVAMNHLKEAANPTLARVLTKTGKQESANPEKVD